MAEDAAAPRLGSRLQVGENRCTVKYVGDLKGRNGIWVGVEWDVESNGENNGSIDGHAYFVTENGMDSGSFIPLDDVEHGVSLVDALIERYKHRIELDHEDVDMMVSATRNKTKKVELVGKSAINLRQSKTHLLTTAELSEGNIVSMGDPDVLEALVPNLEELNLSSNLISEWVEYALICKKIPSLRILNISRCRFSVPEHSECPTVECLKSLILNNCNLEFYKALIIASCSPDLRQIQLLGNSIQHLGVVRQPGITALNQIEVLDLENNLIDDWEEVLHLAQLPKLIRLNLNRNGICRVFHAAGNNGTFFPMLESLSLSRCKIDNVDSIDALDKFPKLKEIRLSFNPVTDTSCPRYEVIARISKLELFNGSKVSSKERVDCERRYLSIIAGDLSQEKDSTARDTILLSHARYKNLLDIHGEICAASQSATSSLTIGDTTIELKLTCVAAASAKNMGTQVKKVPQTMTIGMLKMLIQTIFGMESAQVKLYTTDKQLPVPELIEDDDRLQLKYLDLKNGQEVLIDAV